MSDIGQLPFRLAEADRLVAAIAIQTLFCKLRPSASSGRSLQWLKACRSLKTHRFPAAEQDFLILFINREKDAERRHGFTKRATQLKCQIQRIEAIDCAQPGFDFTPYAREIGDSFYGGTKFLRGAVGCFLSHIKAWKVLIESKHELALICEDDARLLGPPPPKSDNYRFPPGFDIVFANQRLGQGLLYTKDDNELRNQQFFTHESLFDVLRTLSDREEPVAAPGGDGYFISRTGAEKLVELIELTGVTMELDCFLTFYSMTPDQRKTFKKIDGTGRFDRLDFLPTKIDSYVMLPSLVEQTKQASTIAFDNPKNYVDRKDILRSKKYI